MFVQGLATFPEALLKSEILRGPTKDFFWILGWSRFTQLPKMGVAGYLTEKVPAMPEEVRSYVSSLLEENAEELTTVDEIFDAVGDHIQGSVDGGIGEKEVQEMCERLLNILHNGYVSSLRVQAVLVSAVLARW